MRFPLAEIIKNNILKYNSMKKTLFFLFVIFALNICFAQGVMNNTSIIEMKKANLSKPIIINAIESTSDYNFDITTNGLKQLSDNKIDDEIVVLIMKRQKNKSESTINFEGIDFNLNEYGLFINENDIKLKINSHLTQVDMGMKLKAMIPNPSADISIGKDTTTFYFNFNASDNSPTNSVFNVTNSISDPNEGELVKLTKSGKKREFQVGKVGMGRLKSEIPEKIRVEYKVEKIKNNLYKITLKKHLEPGEYGFIFGAINPGATMKIYDFNVK